MPINDQISEALIDKHLTDYGSGFSTDLVRFVIYFCRLSVDFFVSPPIETGLSWVYTELHRGKVGGRIEWNAYPAYK